MQAKPPTCPICGEDVAPQVENRAWPFCSERCRLIDLGNWLGERYRVPAEEPTPGGGGGGGAGGGEAGDSSEPVER